MSTTAPTTPEPASTPRRMSTHRSFTVPSRLQATPRTAPPPEIGAAEGIETLYTHANANIIKFSTAGAVSRPSTSASSPSQRNSTTGPGTLPWATATERTMAAGPMQIYRVPGSVSFLHSGALLHAIMPRSQCWCVDGVSKFAFRVLPDTYYRIELPGETAEDREKVEELKGTLAKVLFYERTACPFARGFHVDVKEEEAPRVPKGRRRSHGRAKRWTLDRPYNWKPEDWEEQQRQRAEMERQGSENAGEDGSESSGSGEYDLADGAEGEQEARGGEQDEGSELADSVPDLHISSTPSRRPTTRSVTAPPQIFTPSKLPPERIRGRDVADGMAEPARRIVVPSRLEESRLRTFQAIPTDMPPSPPDSSAGLETGQEALEGSDRPEESDREGSRPLDEPMAREVEEDAAAGMTNPVHDSSAPTPAAPTTSRAATPTQAGAQQALPCNHDDNEDPGRHPPHQQSPSPDPASATPSPRPHGTTREKDPYAAIQARILARRSIGGNTTTTTTTTTTTPSSSSSSPSSTPPRRTDGPASTTTTTTNTIKHPHHPHPHHPQALTSALAQKAASALLGPPIELAVLMLRIAARLTHRAVGFGGDWGSSGGGFLIRSPPGKARRVPGSFDLEGLDWDGEEVEVDDFGVPLGSPVRLARVGRGGGGGSGSGGLREREREREVEGEREREMDGHGEGQEEEGRRGWGGASDEIVQ